MEALVYAKTTTTYTSKVMSDKLRSLSDKMAAGNRRLSARWNAARWLVSWPVSGRSFTNLA